MVCSFTMVGEKMTLNNVTTSGLNEKEKTNLSRISVGEFYEHYKGKKYKVHAIYRGTEDLILYVCYEALYDCGEYGNLWARPLSMFLETVEFHGKEVPRFRLLSEE